MGEQKELLILIFSFVILILIILLILFVNKYLKNTSGSEDSSDNCDDVCNQVFNDLYINATNYFPGNYISYQDINGNCNNFIDQTPIYYKIRNNTNGNVNLLADMVSNDKCKTFNTLLQSVSNYEFLPNNIFYTSQCIYPIPNQISVLYNGLKLQVTVNNNNMTKVISGIGSLPITVQPNSTLSLQVDDPSKTFISINVDGTGSELSPYIASFVYRTIV